MPEQKAIRLCLKHRDPAGFEFLVQQYKREAFYHAHSLLGNETDAADACQDAFLRAFEAMPRLKSLDHFYPWFYRILRNGCLNMLDRRKTRNAYAKERFTRSDGDVVSDTPETLTAATEDRQEVWRLLGELSSDHREILTLKYIHGFRYDEISDTLEIPRGTVMSRLYAARQAFREKFQDQP
ncbi:MAG: sigma-70 family RNA polymerase sigma factor [Fuerstiella sp.]|nr:sigma-70 family RNA polymerase sigma factor [Fuerstiella sp.]MCP4506684.1 sigma-70 family RNA polymerase sigma factor [Fuerstiella sp.]